jgi:hypothetical protein
MLIKLILVAVAVIVIGTIIYLFMNSKAEADPDPREGKPENDLLKAKNFKAVCQYLLECPDFVDHKEGVFLLITDLATMALKDSTAFGFKECHKAIDISYGETKLKLILSDVAEPATLETSPHKLGNVMVFSGSECVLKTQAEVIASQHGIGYRVWIDQEAVTLIKDGSWLDDLEELIRAMMHTDEHNHSGSGMLTGAVLGSAIGMEMGGFDD